MHFSKVYHEHFVKNPPFFHMKKTNCPKPFALAQTHLKMKNNQRTNFDLMSKKDSYNEGTRSSHFSIISIKDMVGTCLWSWVFIFARPNCLPKSQPMKPKKYSHKGFLLMVETCKTGPSVKPLLVCIKTCNAQGGRRSAPLFTSRPCNNEEQNLMRKTQSWGRVREGQKNKLRANLQHGAWK